MATPAITNTGTTAASALPAAGGISESTISNWAGPYVTSMLGKSQAIANEPYQVYQGPMTAGQSNLQSKVFQGLGGLNFPGNLGQSFASPMAGVGGSMGVGAGSGGGGGAIPPGDDSQYGGAGRPGYDTGADGKIIGGIAGLTAPQTSQQPSNIAQSYMNPYLQSVLNPQLAELRRQNDITNMGTNAKLTQAGAFGGSRQALAGAENNRNLMQEMNKTVGQGYANAYDKAIGQFNTEQGQSKDLVNMLANAGQAERAIDQEGITADYNEFLAQRDYPKTQVQFLQSMLQGIPFQTTTNTPLPKSGMGQLSEIVGSLPGLEDMLKNLKLI